MLFESVQKGRTTGWVKRRGAALVCGVALFIAGPSARAVERWVDNEHPDASDENPGSEAAPWATIQHGALVAEPGDTVFVRAGEYVERVHVTKSGETGAWIALVAVPRREVYMHGFTIVDASYVRLEGFDVRTAPQFDEWNERQGFFVRGRFVEIVDNVIHDLNSWGIAGIWEEPLSEDVYVADNTLYRILLGINVAGRRWLVERNEVRELLQFGNGTCDYSRFFGEDHVFRHNWFHGTDLDLVGDSHVDCFQTYTHGGQVTRNVLFEGNLCQDFHQGLMAKNEGLTDTRDFVLRNNEFSFGQRWGMNVQGISGVRVENNTFAHISQYGVGFFVGSSGNVVLNNIFYRTGSGYSASGDSDVWGDHNLLFEVDEPNQPGPHDQVGVDPDFVDPEGDFHLRAGSPAVDAATALAAVDVDLDGTARPQSTGWDIGAYEYVAPQRAPDANRDGCDCHAVPRPEQAWWLIWALLAIALRRRRRHFDVE